MAYEEDPDYQGVLSFIDSLVLGMSTLTYSASFFEDEEEAEKAKAKDSKSDAVFYGTDSGIIGRDRRCAVYVDAIFYFIFVW